MGSRQTLWPSRWLMTDERLGGRLFDALDALPAGGGVVLRHHALARESRRALGEEVAAQCRARDLLLAVSRDAGLAEALGAALVHNPEGNTALPISLSVHDEAEAEGARARGAALAFLSPVFPTRSHPGRPALGSAAAARLAALAGCPAIALGGMDETRFAGLAGFAGYAGIDCWLGIRT